MAQIYSKAELMPTEKDIEKIISAKLSYETAQKKPDKDAWNKRNFLLTPWGIAYVLSKKKHEQTAYTAKNRGLPDPKPRTDEALRYFIIAVAIGWQELVDQLKRTLKNWGYTTEEFKEMVEPVWHDSTNMDIIAQTVEKVQNGNNITLTEAIEKHDTLNAKLFTKEEVLKERVRNKMLEIVDEFLDDLKEQDIKIKVDDILLIGSNASYNYTKDSDIDLHILANTKGTNYAPEVAAALYSAYRTLFNKQLDIKLFDIPVEIFVETEDSARVSNGVYSVKKDKWIKKPVHEAIPDYDKDALYKLVDKWEEKCKKLIDDIEADKLEDETKVVKMLEDIYDQLRKKGVAKGEYSIENLAFKELRNKGYLDTFKESRNDLVSKRLSLEEQLNKQQRVDVLNQITHISGNQPIIQDNGIFYLYNLKASEITNIIASLRRLPFIVEASAYENGKYDFSDTMHLATNNMPKKYYDIRGKIDETLI